MRDLHRIAAVAISAAFFIASAQAQNMGTISNHAVAVGKGAGVQGVTSVGPGTLGLPLVGAGASADPSFTALGVVGGGTGVTTLAIGDLLQASSSSALSRLAAVATGNVLLSGGVGTASSWGKVGLTTHVSGILPLANGGTGSDLSATGGTSQFLRQNSVGGAISPVRPACSDLSNSTAYCSSTVGQLPGTTTNDSASSGNLGEIISSNVASPGSSITSLTVGNVTSISLTAGDWDVSGNIAFVGNAGCVFTQLLGSISTVSASLPSAPNSGAYTQFSMTTGTASTSVIPVGPMRISLSGTTTVYLVQDSVFSGGTATAFGFMRARRMR